MRRDRHTAGTQTIKGDHYTVAWLRLTFLGLLGIHRFYLGKILTGVLYLLTGGLQDPPAPLPPWRRVLMLRYHKPNIFEIVGSGSDPIQPAAA